MSQPFTIPSVVPSADLELLRRLGFVCEISGNPNTINILRLPPAWSIGRGGNPMTILDGEGRCRITVQNQETRYHCRYVLRDDPGGGSLNVIWDNRLDQTAFGPAETGDCINELRHRWPNRDVTAYWDDPE